MQRIFLLTLLYVVVIFSAVSGSTGVANAVEKVAIIPFEAAEAGKYEVLKDGLKSMISARLASQENIVVLTPTFIGGEQKALVAGYPEETASLFNTFDTDLIGTGRLALVEGKLQIEMTFYSAKGTPPIQMTGEAQNDAQILPTLEILVLQIEDQVFGLEQDPMLAEIDVPRITGTEGFMTEHPDRQYKEEIITGASVSAEDGGVSIARGDLLRRTSELEDGIISMAVDDLDGDGNEEIFVVSNKSLRAMHYDRGLLKQLSEYDFSNSLEVHAINIADFNNDGRGEIYLSSVSNSRFSSVILNWSAVNGFEVIEDTIRFAIRPITLPNGDEILAGQARSLNEEQFLTPGIYVLEQKENGKGFDRGKQMFLPKGVNLFDFTLADLDSDGLIEKIIISRDLKLLVYDSNNNLIWSSSSDFGGGVTKLGSRWLENVNKKTGTGETSKDGFTNADLYYIPVRMIARDGNNDGNIDIVVAKNELSTFRVLKNLRSYKTGKVVCMSWNGSAMQEVWTTDTMDGYVADIYFTDEFGENSMLSDSQDIEKEGKVRLLVSQVAAGGLENLLPFGEAPSNLVVYEFKISPVSGELPGKE